MAAVGFLFCVAMVVHLWTLVGVVNRMAPGADFTLVHAFLVSLAGRVAMGLAAFATFGLPEEVGALAAAAGMVLGDGVALAKLADLGARQAAVAIALWYAIHLLLAVLLAVGFVVLT